MEKCYKCKQALDSNYEMYYLDRNNNLTTETEAEAFYTLHPHERGKLKFKKVFVCSLCAFSMIKNKSPYRGF